jgi:hypothetical protein
VTRLVGAHHAEAGYRRVGVAVSGRARRHPDRAPASPHPQVLVEAEQLAAGFLSQEDRHAVAEDVADELRTLHLSQLADRAGPQWGGGYVDPHDAADEMLDEIV